MVGFLRNLFKSIDETPIESKYNERGFNVYGIHKNGTCFIKKGFAADGFDHEGYNKLGFNRQGYNEFGYDKNGYNEQGYDCQGFNRKGERKFGKSDMFCL